MSTKINNGYQIHVETLGQLWEWRANLLKRFKTHAKTQLSAHIAKKAVYLADDRWVKPFWGFNVPNPGDEAKITLEGHESALRVSKRIAWEGLRESDTHCLRDKFEIEISVHKAGKKTLALVIGPGEVNKWFRSQPKVSEYHYQDSTDKPKHISKKDWNQRKKDWDKALPTGVPKESGLIFFGEEPRLFLYDIQKFRFVAPSKKERALRLAKAILLDKRIRAYDKTRDPNEPVRMSTYTNLMEEAYTHRSIKPLTRIIETQLRNYRSWEDIDKAFCAPPKHLTRKFKTPTP